MHDEQMQFIATVKSVFPRAFENVSVLEVGSYDVNGSIRPLFNARDYVGIDLIKGPGVDVVCPGHQYSSEQLFDVAVSAECFEHNAFWRETFVRMARQTRPGGMVIVTCASEGRPAHGTSLADPESSPGTVRTGSDYYQNLTAMDFVDLDLGVHFLNWKFFSNAASHDLYFVGLRLGARGAQHRLDSLERLCAANERTSLALHRAIDLLRSGSLEEALAIATEAKEQASPACTEQACRILGWALRLAGNLDQSEQVLRTALSIGSTPDAYFHLALTLRRMGRLPEAAGAARRAVGERPGVAGYVQLADALRDF